MLTRAMLLPVLLFLVTFCAGCFESKVVVTKVAPTSGTCTAASRIGAGKTSAKMNGIFYALPRTVIKTDVALVRKDFSPGKYLEYAKLFFPDDDINADTDKSTFSIETASFTTVGEPDPCQIYQVEIPAGGLFVTKSLLMELTEEAVPTKLQAETKNEALDVAIAGFKSFASIAAPLITAAQGVVPVTPPTPPRTNPPPPEADFLKNLSAEEVAFYQGLPTKEEKLFYRTLGAQERSAYQKLNQAERDFYRTLTPEEAAFYRQLNQDERDFFRTLNAKQRTTLIGSTFLALDQSERDYLLQLLKEDLRRLNDFQVRLPKAKEVHKKIIGLIAAREKLIATGIQSSGAPISEEALKLMLKELDDEIDNLKNTYFLGSVITTKDQMGSFSYRPIEGGSFPMNQDLFKFSKTRGVSEVLVDQGIKAPKKFFRAKICTDPSQPGIDLGNNCDEPKEVAVTDAVNVSLNLTAGRDGLGGPQLAGNIEHANLELKGDRGFYYRIPATILVRLFEGQSDKDHERGRNNLSVAQLGITASLPAAAGGRRTSYTLALYEGSGALKNFLLGSDSAVTKSNVEDIGDATKTLIESSDQVKKLQRQKDLLQLQKDINTLKKDIDAQQKPQP